MFTSKDYTDIYDGMSYVQYRSMPQNWWECVDHAKRIAESEFGGGTIIQWWNGSPQHDDTIGYAGKNVVVLQSHGRNWGVNVNLDPDFGTSMARRLGFSRDEWLSLPPVFDRRSPVRESQLIQRYAGNGKPTFLYNFSGISSPFAYVPEMMRLLHPFRTKFNMVDLSQIHAHRIYDLLGLFDQAAGLITIDTSTFHLAPASNVPWIGLRVDGWCQSVPKNGCVFDCYYSQVPKKLKEMENVIASFLH